MTGHQPGIATACDINNYAISYFFCCHQSINLQQLAGWLSIANYMIKDCVVMQLQLIQCGFFTHVGTDQLQYAV